MAVVPALATAETGHYEDENEHPRHWHEEDEQRERTPAGPEPEHDGHGTEQLEGSGDREQDLRHPLAARVRGGSLPGRKLSQSADDEDRSEPHAADELRPLPDCIHVLLRPRQMLHSRSRSPRSISLAPTLNPGTTLRPTGGPSPEPRSAVPLRRVRNRAGSGAAVIYWFLWTRRTVTSTSMASQAAPDAPEK